MRFNKEKVTKEFRKFKPISMGDKRNTQVRYNLGIVKSVIGWLAEDIECPRCKGVGHTERVSELLKEAYGTTNILKEPCYKCQGKGTITNAERFIE